MPKQAMGSKKLTALTFDSTVIRFDLEHHLLDINLERRGVKSLFKCMERNMSYQSITKFYKTLKFNLLCSKTSKYYVKWAGLSYMALP